ncbi:hypothetical protein [Flavobacterium sp. LAR06]|uniref:hypothetical protein n=1 Tax=Flavobacterium sp. LAR06 TaxID=3064897 RepID=UPI0035BF9EFD
MRKILLFGSMFTILLSSCTPSLKYVYDLKKPVKSNNLEYSDEKIEASFIVNNADINLSIKNLTERPLKIVWDDCSFVKSGEAQKILHKNTKFIDKEKSQPATTIPPNSLIKDIVQPIDDIELTETITHNHRGRERHNLTWSTTPFFPVPRRISSHKITVDKYYRPLIGKTLGVYLPIQYDSKTMEYFYEFELTDIVLVKGKKQKRIFN